MTLSCISCRTTFTTFEEQRSHYKSEFHRFNLKRKVASLVPVTIEVFEEKFSANREADQETKVQLNTYCPYCEKSYASQKAFEQHCLSKKHLEKKIASGEDQDDMVLAKIEKNKKKQLSRQEENQGQSDEKLENEEIDEEKLIEEQIKKGVALPLEQCMFCNEIHSDFEQNLEHMTKHHGLFIPDLEFVSDLTGLISYLSQKVSFGFTCLYCTSGKVYSRMEAVQAHMRDLCHCKIRFETEEEQEEYDDFYDYTKSHSAENSQTSSSTAIESFDKMQQSKVGLDEADAFALSLPSGKVVGHRSLALYYKQKPRPNESREPLVVSKLLTQYHNMGWVSKPDVQHLVIKQERQIRRLENKYHSQLGIKANKLQHHFRCQTPL